MKFHSKGVEEYALIAKGSPQAEDSPKHRIVHHIADSPKRLGCFRQQPPQDGMENATIAVVFHFDWRIQQCLDLELHHAPIGFVRFDV